MALLTNLRERVKQHTKLQPNGCIEGTTATDWDGYCLIKIAGKSYRLHRVVYELEHGYIDDSKLICHTCDNPKCCNIAHLFEGTYQDNTDDMISKGRNIRGCHSPNTKMTEEDIRMIRRDSLLGMGCAAIARKYKIGASSASRIIKGSTYKEVK